jgi:hypothetical protein
MIGINTYGRWFDYREQFNPSPAFVEVAVTMSETDAQMGDWLLHAAGILEKRGESPAAWLPVLTENCTLIPSNIQAIVSVTPEIFSRLREVVQELCANGPMGIDGFKEMMEPVPSLWRWQLTGRLYELGIISIEDDGGGTYVSPVLGWTERMEKHRP